MATAAHSIQMHPRTKFLLQAGIVLYALGVIGIGVLHFIFPGFRPIMIPIPASATEGIEFVPKLTGLILVVLGVMISFRNRLAKSAALWLAIFCFGFFLFGHLPLRIKNHPDILAYWTDALKMLTMTGGAMLISFFNHDAVRPPFLAGIAKYALIGQYFFAIMLMIFGIDHFLYNQPISTIIPSWIPQPRFWTYFTGAALFFSGVSIFLNIGKAAASFLLACMIFSWFFLVHLRLIDFSRDSVPVELVGALTCLIFCGVALLIHVVAKQHLLLRDQVKADQ